MTASAFTSPLPEQTANPGYACLGPSIWKLLTSNLLPLIRNPLIRNPPLGGTGIFYHQFKRRHDHPPHKKRFLVRSTPLIRNPP